MGIQSMSRSAVVAAGAAVMFLGLVAGGAWAAVPPAWECVPTAAGKPVVSGGTGSAPSCGAGTTAVLAPTYISAGAGGKPTVRFTAVNVQVVSGSGGTNGAVNGTGNLVIGYDENPSARKQTGSHDLILGRDHSFTGYAELVGGFQNTANGNYSAVLGNLNTVAGSYASVTGGQSNAANGMASSITGGEFNNASDRFSSITAGCENVAGAGSFLSGSCAKAGLESITGGELGAARGTSASISGGNTTQALGTFSSVLGGFGNTASGTDASVSGGGGNTASGFGASILGGDANTVSTNCGTFPDTGQSC